MSGATRDELAFVRKLVRDQSGMVLNEDKEYLIVSKLNSLARKERIASLGELVRQLRDPSSTALRRAATEEMLIGETCFFRDGHPFEALRSSVLPELVRQRTEERALNLWCAAAATGQEPYSLAIVLSEALPELSRWCVRLIATDLSETNLLRARAGLYSELEMSRGMPEPMRARYFSREGEGFRVHDSLRRRVEFLRMNLVLDWPVLPLLDLVLMRNVLIYFDAATRVAIIARVREHLRPGGYLLLGTSEALVDEAVGFTPVRIRSTVFYRRDP